MSDGPAEEKQMRGSHLRHVESAQRWLNPCGVGYVHGCDFGGAVWVCGERSFIALVVTRGCPGREQGLGQSTVMNLPHR